MPSTWSLERFVALLAAATLEAAWLTLAYLLVQWLSGDNGAHLGLVAFGLAAALGLLLARLVAEAPRGWYAAVVVGATVVTAALGTLLLGGTSTSGVHAGGWLLGLALWRGSLHAELDDEAELSEAVVRAGVPGLIAFWVIATVSEMVAADQYTAPAFVATLAFVGAGLLALGLARLVDLEVEQVDRAARRRWVTLLVAISAVVLLVAVPIAAVLGVPVASSLEALAGPLAPLLIQGFLLLLIPFALLAELFIGLLRALFTPSSPGPLPSLAPQPSASPLPTDQPAFGAPDVFAWLGIVAVIAVIAIALMVATALARPPARIRRAARETEVRESEPVDFDLRLRLPRLRLPVLRTPAPRSAEEAYRFTLLAMQPTDEARLPAETPREHARRVGAAYATDLRRLAADYQLAAFANAPISVAEQRRAIGRWQRIVRATRGGVRR